MKYFLFIIITITSYSCRIRGITNDYQYLHENQKTKILPLSTFAEAKNGFVYMINGAQLRNELKNHEKSIVYVFKNGCTSDHCKPLIVYETFARNNGYQLFLVMDGYINFDASMDQHIAGNLFVIDNDYYKEKKRLKYSRLFENDLCNLPSEHKENSYKGNLYFFNSDKLEKILIELPK